MSFFEDFSQLLFRGRLGLETRGFSESLSQTLSHAMHAAGRTCDTGELDVCRDDSAAMVLKFVAIASILLAGAAGVSVPIMGRERRFLRTDSSFFLLVKAFAAGVILATGFVHMLAGGSEALTSPCLSNTPWSRFPFPGFLAMVAALATLLVDFLGTQYYERKQRLNWSGRIDPVVVSSALDIEEEAGILREKLIGEEVNIIGMHCHEHSHPNRHESSGLVHSHGHGSNAEEDGTRHVVVSQILELGIVSHSIIIGLSLGVSHSPCTIRPLIAALSFHQFFEGFALGGCISQAQFPTRAATIMACFFAVTTPIGIGAGMAIASSYNPSSVGALVAEGILDSLSAGILVYMALVDLVAADFLSKKMRNSDFRLQVTSYFLLFLGAGSMSSLAIWA